MSLLAIASWSLKAVYLLNKALFLLCFHRIYVPLHRVYAQEPLANLLDLFNAEFLLEKLVR